MLVAEEHVALMEQGDVKGGDEDGQIAGDEACRKSPTMLSREVYKPYR